VNGWLEDKKKLLAFLLCRWKLLAAGFVFLAQCAPPQRCTQCEDRVVEGGGVDRGHVGACCKPNRGNLIRRITVCVSFPNQHPLFFCLFANLGLCWERRTPAAVAATESTEQILGGAYLTCVASLPRCFGGLC
jgi:hypothetical protein